MAIFLRGDSGNDGALAPSTAGCLQWSAPATPETAGGVSATANKTPPCVGARVASLSQQADSNVMTF